MRVAQTKMIFSPVYFICVTYSPIILFFAALFCLYLNNQLPTLRHDGCQDSVCQDGIISQTTYDYDPLQKLKSKHKCLPGKCLARYNTCTSGLFLDGLQILNGLGLNSSKLPSAPRQKVFQFMDIQVCSTWALQYVTGLCRHGSLM